jgi:hypothetical protein
MILELARKILVTQRGSVIPLRKIEDNIKKERKEVRYEYAALGKMALDSVVTGIDESGNKS